MGMAAAKGGGSGGRRRRGVPRYGAMADINMTPFIDVMLVLLIIFMVAAPLLATGVPIDVPQTSAGPINVDQKPITISIDEKGDLFLQDQPLRVLTNGSMCAAPNRSIMAAWRKSCRSLQPPASKKWL